MANEYNNALTEVQKKLRNTNAVEKDSSGKFVVKSSAGATLGSYKDEATAKKMAKALEAGLANMVAMASVGISAPTAQDLEKLRKEGFNDKDIADALKVQQVNKEISQITLARMLETQAKSAGISPQDVYKNFAGVLANSGITEQNLSELAAKQKPERPETFWDRQDALKTKSTPSTLVTKPATTTAPAASTSSGSLMAKPVSQTITPAKPLQNTVMESAPSTQTFSSPTQTQALSAVPEQVTAKTNYAGTTGLVDPTLTAPSQGIASGAIENVTYKNALGQQVLVTEVSGQPTTYVPPGFTKAQSAGMAEGGSVPKKTKKPNLKEFMDATGVDSKTATELLYGTVGANSDVRDWNAIMSSGNPVDAARKATGEMYSGNSPATAGITGNPKYATVGGNFEQGGVVKTTIDGRETYAIVSADGLLLRGAGSNLERAMEQAKNFGLDRLIGEGSYTAGIKPQTQDQPTQTQDQPTQPQPSLPNQTQLDASPVPKTQTIGVTAPQYSGGMTQVTPTNPQAGTFSTPLQTGNLSAVPQQVTVKTNYAGTPGLVDPSMTSASQNITSGAIENVAYKNSIGQQVYVTEVNGQPTTYVPPGFIKAQSTGMAEGGVVDHTLQAEVQMARRFLNYQGPASRRALDAFTASNPGAAARMGKYRKAMMAKGGLVGMAEGGSVSGYAAGGFTVRRVGGRDGADFEVRDSANKYVGTFGSEEEAKAEIAKRNAAAATTTSTTTPTTGTPTTPTTGTPTTPTTGTPTTPTTPTTGTPTTTPNPMSQMSSNLIQQTMQPVQANISYLQPQAADFIPVDAGQTVPVAPFAEAATAKDVQQANLPVVTPASLIQVASAADQVQAQTAATQAQQGQVSQQAQVQAAQQTGATAVSQLEAAQGNAYLMNNPLQREIQAGELISGSSVDAAKVEQLNASLQAAEATPSEQATVQGQMANLMSQFEGGKTPAWAAGAMRNATAMLSARGLGASSIAGQAVIQAAMEAALPIAQVDAQTRAQFESQNLTNRQQTAMFAAQQRAQFLQIEFDQDFQARVQNSARIGDIANMNFTAEQNIALENSRAVNTVNLQNLTNRQAKVMAEAAALANLEITNLNNRQQAAVQNAQAFLQMDMTNVSNAQQTELFKAQQNIQALFTDQAAENAARQFNAASKNQTDQFFANLSTQTSQFNASQQNAMDQFNLNSVNAMRQFNSEIQQQRDLFNAQNGLVIAQSNAQWRQNIATLNTAAQNQSNAEFAKTLNAMTTLNLDQVWQRERDVMAYTFTAFESDKDRALELMLADKREDLAKMAEKSAETAAAAEFFLKLAFS